MRFLLDTHVVVRRCTDDPALSPAHRRLLDEAARAGERVGVSAVTLWEIAKLVEIGRLKASKVVDALIEEIESHPEVEVLPLTGRICVESTRLGPTFPRDPADQLIAATARYHGLTLLTNDERIRSSRVVAIE